MEPIDIVGIMKHLPHRYPFLLVDRVLELEKGKSVVALKNVSMNEPFFQGHFPKYPVMPGVLILEALAQAAGILTFKSIEPAPSEDTILFYAGIDNARFKRQVVPGDQLILKAEIVASKRGIWKYVAKAYVGDELACEADLMCAQREVTPNN
ncbi:MULTISPECIES: 3-hydroxyacyl-ACP dehydratase FabZ [Deefgea]|uniref:3-hydroxyacyl-[acyl-carrier-protein] dehydratase FabZ n=1 Tax=Deefgea piscis TaxID=2739061 RepID=A0A6M8SRM4_9NEIS|nr:MULTISPECIES: 3-hydroxyacyl-ACP dehydratase FabZ [Deefgea]QKJ67845.1 3-hydroxyacyl-ACP dehydratase FabZ [Deefgea piscis]QZA79981.1 3-hydroxyacyl-ACP dehydratase FabZ [Deefgea piscis]